MGHLNKSHEWFENKVKEYHGNKVELLSTYAGSEKPIDIVYHCEKHGDTFKTINAKNICKPYFLPCKQCQSIRKSKSHKAILGKTKQYYYDRLVEYCKSHGGTVLEKEWTRAKDTYHFKCDNPDHPIFTTTADALYSGEHWCPYCSGRAGNFKEEIAELCREKGGELLSDYVTAGSYVTVRCNKHNYIWNILPNNIRKGRWCPICNMGFNEKVVYDYLKNMQSNFQIQYSFDDLIGKNHEKLRFDFAVFNSKNILISLIEVDDEEHRDRHLGNSLRQISRKEARERDLEKDEYCKSHNIPLHRMEIPFRSFKKWDYDDYYKYINTELKEIINKARMED